jgi:hypothetical protein
MAASLVRACRRAEKGDRLTSAHAASELADQLVFRLYLAKVADFIFGPVDRRSVLAIEVGVEGTARSEVREKRIPRFFFLLNTTRAVATDQQSEAVVRFNRIVPALRLDAPGGYVKACSVLDRASCPSKRKESTRAFTRAGCSFCIQWLASIRSTRARVTRLGSGFASSRPR